MGIYTYLAIMYPEGNWFEFPLTCTVCGNLVLTKANLSSNKYRIAVKLRSLMQLRTHGVKQQNSMYEIIFFF